MKQLKSISIGNNSFKESDKLYLLIKELFNKLKSLVYFNINDFPEGEIEKLWKISGRDIRYFNYNVDQYSLN